MSESPALHSGEEDGVQEVGSADDKLLVEDYLEETLLEPQVITDRSSRRDEGSTVEGARQAAAPNSTEGGHRVPDGHPRSITNENSNQQRRAPTGGEKSSEGEVLRGADDREQCTALASHPSLDEKDTVRGNVADSGLLSGKKETEWHMNGGQKLYPGRRDGEVHLPSSLPSRADTVTAHGDREQLLSEGGGRTPIFLTDRGARPLSTNASPFPQPPSSALPTYEEDGNAKTFGGQSSSSSTGRLALFDSLDNGPKIREGFERLTQLLGGLDEKVEKLLGEHERDFLLAYRTHMYAIQQQMEYFKRKADEEQAKILRDMKIRSLEKELSWFMSEALRLDGLCKHYQSNLEKWRTRAEALSEDRNFLETQIKTCKRQSRALQARFDDLQNAAGGLEKPDRQISKEGPASEDTTVVKTRTRDIQDKTSSESMRLSVRQVAPKVSCGTGISDMSAQALKIQNERLRSELEHTKKQYKQLLSLQQSQMMSCKGEYENFFVKCCNEIRREIQNRRVRALQLSSFPSALKRDVDAYMLDEDLMHEVSLQDFLQADRRRLLELIVSSDELLSRIVLRRLRKGRDFTDATTDQEYSHNNFNTIT